MIHSMDLATVGIWVQALILFIGFCCTSRQLQLQVNDSKSRLIIELKHFFIEFREVTIALRPGGKWEEEIPNDSQTWGLIDNYLGLFEHCEYLLSMKMMIRSSL